MSALDSIADITVFARVAAGGSLSAAARELDLSLAVVSKRLARLEKTLGVRLINRTTRRLSLTGEGEDFLRHANRILSEVDEAQDLLSSRAGTARGLLRVTATAAFARGQLAPRLVRFHQRHPAVQVQLVVTDTVVDLVQNGIDLAIRQGVLPDSAMMVRELAPNGRVLCAAPDYLARRGLPRCPHELVHHDCITFGEPPNSSWSFQSPSGDSFTVSVSGSVITSDGDCAHAAALAGSGIVVKSALDVAEDLRCGRLVALMPSYSMGSSPIQVVYPSSRQLPAKVRVFIDFLAEEMKTAVGGL